MTGDAPRPRDRRRSASSLRPAPPWQRAALNQASIRCETSTSGAGQWSWRAEVLIPDWPSRHWSGAWAWTWGCKPQPWSAAAFGTRLVGHRSHPLGLAPAEPGQRGLRTASPPHYPDLPRRLPRWGPGHTNISRTTPHGCRAPYSPRQSHCRGTRRVRWRSAPLPTRSGESVPTRAVSGAKVPVADELEAIIRAAGLTPRMQAAGTENA